MSIMNIKTHIIILLLVSKSSIAQTTLIADFETHYQTIDNFGASDAWVTNGIGIYWSEETKTHIAELLFSQTKGIGLSAWRFNIGAGSAVTDTDIIPNWKFWRRAACFQQEEGADFDWKKQAGQQYFLQKAADYGVSDLIAFLNSPPVWATKNGHAQCDSSVGSTNLKDDYEDEFATFMVTVVKHFRAQGIAINYLSPINEPSWAWNNAQQEGCRYNNDDIIRVIEALYDELEDQNLTSKVAIDAPEATEYTAALDNDVYNSFTRSTGGYGGGMNGKGEGTYRNYIKLMLENQNFADKIDHKVALHGYFSDSWNNRLTKLRELVKENVAHYDEDARIWMTEYTILGGETTLRPFVGGGRDLSMTLGLHTAKIIHSDLTRMNANAWHWWTAISKENYKDGLLYTDWNADGDQETLYTSKNLWAMGNYSRFIRPGYQRIDVQNPDDWEGLMASGYRSPIGDKLVFVYINSSSSAIQVNTEIANVPTTITSITPYTTSDSQDLEQGATFTSLNNYEIPANAIVTLVVQLKGLELATPTFENAQNIKIYPVPVCSDQLTVELASAQNAKLRLFNTTGQLVFSAALKKGNTVLRLHELDAGIYFTKITNDAQVTVRKIIKK